MLTLGSLFDGIAGFPESARRHGIKTLWASEIEPLCIKVSKAHFPGMKHLGSVTDINGAELEPVDIITFGSPCQDLSVAGKRKGLEGERSHLFFEAVRIIAEMRKRTHKCYPSFAIWENVPGALSSNGGRDFRAVLEALTEAEIPMPPSGKWAEAGMVRGNGREVAWRCLDAQYWGVPQRRKRIFLVVDFGGYCASEILFESESLPGDITESGKAREEVAACVRDGVEATSGTEYLTGWDCQEKRIFTDRGVAPTLAGSDGGGGRTGVGYVAQPIAFNGRQDPVSGPATGALDTDELTQCVAFGPGGQYEVSHAIRAQASKADKPDSTIYIVHPKTTGTLCASGAGMSRPAGQGNETDMVVAIQHSIIGRKDSADAQVFLSTEKFTTVITKKFTTLG